VSARAVGLTVLGGLLLAGGTSASWVRDATVRDVAGVAVAAETNVPGTRLEGWLVGAGVAAVLCGLALLLPAPRLRRALAVLTAAVGLAGLAGVTRGALRAVELPGALSSGPGIAAVGALAVLAGAVLVLRRPREHPALPPRYDLDAEDASQHEWQRASVEPDAGNA
jgi:hypothetical protein